MGMPPTRAGIELRRCGLADEQTLIARGFYAEGLTLVEIAAEFGGRQQAIQAPAGGLRHGMIKLSGFRPRWRSWPLKSVP